MYQRGPLMLHQYPGDLVLSLTHGLVPKRLWDKHGANPPGILDYLRDTQCWTLWEALGYADVDTLSFGHLCFQQSLDPRKLLDTQQTVSSQDILGDVGRVQ